MHTYGGGLHVLKWSAPPRAGANRLFDFVDRSRMVISWTPADVGTHVMRVTFLMPKLRVPLVGRALETALARVLARQDWGGSRQDTAVMLHRQEPVSPAYLKADRMLLKFRRFWDSRLLDRTLWEGDNIHSNGLRAGIQWPDAPREPSLVAQPSTVAAEK
jgi:hypothetical protein